ncbi:exonuclease subunit SbcD [Amphritea sp. 2_MG-2023]|uniref:exonuclease subunit SbcD n=1 Tax=Amphritea TaxID=515417 RepID=UPI001C07DE73|nr:MULTISPECIES: exonuclease subunit SbcD [Amphritea]MBU2967349.1 exonuclease subunit SbcD [Amphritea atlantica]MDO6418396.1 exonuclease subunit SbcD [Amphritea sp. 2_MG-2023]
MKILHTSDWHLGQSFFTKSRKAEHQSFLNWLLAQVAAHDIDAVIVAGDIFDTGTPPSYAREMYNRFIVDISQLNCTLVVLGGNHDSVSTLNESKQLVACLNTHVVAQVVPNSPLNAELNGALNNAADSAAPDEMHPQIIELQDRGGKIGAILCAIPFIRPRDVVQSRAGESGLEKRQALGEAIKEHYHQLYQAALADRQAKQLDVPIIATGHLTALGVSQSDSVRDIYIGTLDGFAADGFPPADYIALGHIHRPQIVAKSEHIRYSGSPIPLSFDELKTTKQVIMVTFNGAERVAITPLDVPMFQPMAIIKGNLSSIETQLNTLANSGAGEGASSVWLCIEVEVEDYLTDLPQRIQSLTEGLPVEVLQLRRSRHTAKQGLTQTARETLAELTPQDVFAKRLELESFEGEVEQQRLERIKIQFRQILAEVQDGEQNA